MKSQLPTNEDIIRKHEDQIKLLVSVCALYEKTLRNLEDRIIQLEAIVAEYLSQGD